MQTEKDTKANWADLAALIAGLPAEEQAKFQNNIRYLIHDLRQCLNIHQSAEAILRQTIPNTPENLELLDSIRTANKQALALITDLSHPFDRENGPPRENHPT